MENHTPSTSSTPKPNAPVPAIDRSDLMAKLEAIPTETLRSILSNQVDLEIRLKHKELKLTEEELGKCEAQMLALRQFFEVPKEVTFNNEPNDFTLKYYNVLSESLLVSYTKLQQQQYMQALAESPYSQFNQNIFGGEPEPAPTYRTRSTTSSLRPSLNGVANRIPGCLYRRTDGVVVRITCPDCHRSNFLSAQGFLNHLRIAHSKEFTSQDAAALRCGEILPDEFQDEEGMSSLSKLRQKDLDPLKNLNVNEIYFNGLSNSLNTMHKQSLERVALPTAADNSGSKELMKKVVGSGYSAADFQQIVADAKLEVASLHLFNDEEEEEKEIPEEAKSYLPVPSKQDVNSNPAETVPGNQPSHSEAEAVHVSAAAGVEALTKETHSDAEKSIQRETRSRRRKSRGAMAPFAPDSEDNKRAKR